MEMKQISLVIPDSIKLILKDHYMNIKEDIFLFIMMEFGKHPLIIKQLMK